MEPSLNAPEDNIAQLMQQSQQAASRRRERNKSSPQTPYQPSDFELLLQQALREWARSESSEESSRNPNNPRYDGRSSKVEELPVANATIPQSACRDTSKRHADPSTIERKPQKIFILTKYYRVEMLGGFWGQLYWYLQPSSYPKLPDISS